MAEMPVLTELQEAILDVEDDAVAYRAVRDVLDRIGTRTVDHAHAGHFDVDVAISAAREQLEPRSTRLAALAGAARTLLGSEVVPRHASDRLGVDGGARASP